MTSVKLQMDDVVASIPALDAFIQRELPAVAAWRLAKASRKLHAENDAYMETHRKKVQQYGTEQPDTTWLVDKENVPKFTEEIQEVLDQEVELDLPLISFEQLGEGPFKPIELAPLWFLFEEEQK